MRTKSILHSIFAGLALLAAAACSAITPGRDAEEIHAKVEEGAAQYNDGNYTAALTTFHDVIPDTAAMTAEDYVKTFFLLGNIHFAYQDYAKAAPPYEKAFARATREGNHQMEMRLAVNLAMSAALSGDKGKTDSYIAILDRVPTPDKKQSAYFRRLLGCYRKMLFGDEESAISEMKGVVAYVDSSSLPQRLKLSPYSAIFEQYENHGRLDSALRYLELYADLAQRHNLSNMIVDSRRSLMRIYAKLGDSANTLRYQDEYFHLQDSLLNPGKYMRLNTAFQQDAEKESNARIASLSLKVTYQQIAIATIMLVIMMAFIYVYMHQRLKSANRQLFLRNKDLAQLRQQEAQEENGASGADIRLFDRIKTFLELEKPYCDPDFSLSMLADRMDSNTKYVSQAINVCSGGNFRSFVNTYRVNEAMSRLTDVDSYGHSTIQGIGESVGFSSPSVFNAAFKKVTGMTPSLYQKMAKSEENTSKSTRIHESE